MQHLTVESWLEQYCRWQRLDWQKLSSPEKSQVLRQVPCTLRCWRIGDAVDGQLGKPCVECGFPIKDLLLKDPETVWALLDSPIV